MSDVSQGPGWWQASDGKWYPPEQAPGGQPAAGPPPGFAGQPAAQPGAQPGYGAPAYGTPGGAPPAATGGASVGDAFNYGWQKFQQNVGPILVTVLVLLVISFVIQFFIQFVVLASVANDSTGLLGFILIGAYSLIAVLLNFLIQMAIIRAGLILTEGRPLEQKDLLSTDQIGPYVIASILLSIGVGIGFILCFIPGLIVLFFGQWFGYFVLDRKQEPVDALKSSFTFVNENLGTVIVFFLASLLAYFIGAILCGIGLLVAIPVVVIAQAYLYKRLTGLPVAA